LRNAGLISPSLGADSVRVVPQQDGYYRCYLSEASNDEARLFAESLDELLAPLDNSHYIVPRFISGEPRAPLAALGIALRGAPERLPSRSVVYHAVPSALGANRKRVSAFEKAWNRYVSAGSALYFKDPRARRSLKYSEARILSPSQPRCARSGPDGIPQAVKRTQSGRSGSWCAVSRRQNREIHGCHQRRIVGAITGVVRRTIPIDFHRTFAWRGILKREARARAVISQDQGCLIG